MTEDSKKKPYVHHCHLPRVSFINHDEGHENWCTKLFIKLCFISPHVSNRKIYNKSSKVIDKERLNHWENHMWIIHPFSDFIYYVEIIMALVYFLRLNVVPYIIMLHYTHIGYVFLRLSLKFFTFLYIGIQFFTGYYSFDIKEVMLDHKQIVKKYLRTYFIPDFLGNVPISEALYIYGYEKNEFKIFQYFVIFNIFSLIKCVGAFQQKRDLNLIAFKLINWFLILGTGLTWLTALAYLISCLEESATCNVSNWWWAFHIYAMVFGFGAWDKFATDFVILLNILSLSFGYMIRSIIIVKVVLWGQQYCFNEKKKHCLSKAINEFCHYHKIPSDLKSKIMQYYEYKFQNVYYNEQNIFDILSESMNNSIEAYECKQWFDTDIFKLCPLALKQIIAMSIEKNIYLENDVIHSIGDSYDRLYFIKYGTVIKYNLMGGRVSILEEGIFFAKKTLLIDFLGLHKHKAVAAENSTIFSLPRNKIEKIMRKFPEDYANILKILETIDPSLNSSIIS